MVIDKSSLALHLLYSRGSSVGAAEGSEDDGLVVGVSVRVFAVGSPVGAYVEPGAGQYCGLLALVELLLHKQSCRTVDRKSFVSAGQPSVQEPCNHHSTAEQDTHAEVPGYEKYPSWQLVQAELPVSDTVPLGHITNVLAPPGQ